MKIVIMFVLIVALFIGAACHALSPSMDKCDWHRTTYTVQRGDTLWSIAGKYCPPEVDRREWIDKVKSINNIDATIYAGERIIVLADE